MGVLSPGNEAAGAHQADMTSESANRTGEPDREVDGEPTPGERGGSQHQAGKAARAAPYSELQAAKAGEAAPGWQTPAGWGSWKTTEGE